MKPFWITFYSYKGGVGRSLALANIAALLVQRGRRVVLIDFDLEAPGLDSFTEFEPCRSMPGVVEYVADFEKTHIASDIRSYIHPCVLPGNLRGKLWVMPAGRKDKSYNQMRVGIDWINLYEEKGGAKFVENWKASIYEAFQPDYVLVDSRTGLTDIGGICTLHLPDLVVLLFGLNEQNIKGIASVAQVIRESSSMQPRHMLAVATPVPQLLKEESILLRARLDKAMELLGFDSINQISYFPQAALAERLFVLDASTTQIEYEYDDLLSKCINLNRNGIDFLIEKAEEACTALDETRGLQIASVLTNEYPNRAESLYWAARVQRAFGKRKEAIANAEKAFMEEPEFSPTLELLQELMAKTPQLLVKIINRMLKKKKDINASVLDDIYRAKGDIAMQTGDYMEALRAFDAKFALQLEKQPLLELLADSFNVLESARRAKGPIDADLWSRVIKLYEGFQASNLKQSSECVANHHQAMHVAYACIGHLEKARQSLRSAEAVAQTLGVVDEVFCLANYKNVSPKEFLAANQKMIKALDKGYLWDGMKLNPIKPRRRLLDMKSTDAKSARKSKDNL